MATRTITNTIPTQITLTMILSMITTMILRLPVRKQYFSYSDVRAHDHSTGRSDGQCVQRAGRNQHEPPRWRIPLHWHLYQRGANIGIAIYLSLYISLSLSLSLALSLSLVRGDKTTRLAARGVARWVQAPFEELRERYAASPGAASIGGEYNASEPTS